MESFDKSSEQFLALDHPRITTQQKNISFLHDLNCEKPSQNVSMINKKLQNKSFSLQSQQRYHRDIQTGRCKSLKNIDKKILQTARKLSPPCKDNNLRTIDAYVIVSHPQDKK
jgi:hypothetical protein